MFQVKQRMGKLSLKARNPFGKDIELVSMKTWIGLGGFAVMLGTLAVMVSWVKGRAEKVGNPIDMAWAAMEGAVR